MKKLLLAAVFIFLLFPLSYTQDSLYLYKNYSWGNDPQKFDLTTEETQAESIITKEVRRLEYLYNATGKLDCYRIIHRRVKLLTEKSIDLYNKVYIPLGGVEEIINIKARSIAPDGSVKELSKNNIKEVDDPDNKENYKIFAIEGLQTGGEMEYFYVIRISPYYYGSEKIQTAVPKHHFAFSIVSPSNLIFTGKLYNIEADVHDSLFKADNTRVLEVKDDYIAPLKEEVYSNYDAHTGRFEFKLSYNTYNGNAPIFTYTSLNQWTSDNYFNIPTGTLKSVKSYLGPLLKSSKDPYEVMRKAEDKIKSEFGFTRAGIDENADINWVIKNKVFNQSWSIVFYAAIARLLDIPYNIVYTCDRNDAEFDDKFETYNYTRDMMLYFPDKKIYLEPEDFLSRLGFINPGLSGNKGLFMRPVEFNGIISALKEVKYIEPLPAAMNTDSEKVNVRFYDDMEGVDLDIERSLTGMAARNIQSFFYLLKEEDYRNEMLDTYLKLYREDQANSEYKVYGGQPEDIYRQPFRMTCKGRSELLVENAGSKYLFKVGELIGQQMEIYKEEVRKLPVSHDYNKTYHREIVVNIPAGFSVLNVSELNMDIKTTESNGEVSAAFISSARTEGDQVIITIDEYYRQLTYPLERYEEFRQVINAAADFNKKVLIFEPK